MFGVVECEDIIFFIVMEFEGHVILSRSEFFKLSSIVFKSLSPKRVDSDHSDLTGELQHIDAACLRTIYEISFISPLILICLLLNEFHVGKI